MIVLKLYGRIYLILRRNKNGNVIPKATSGLIKFDYSELDGQEHANVLVPVQWAFFNAY